MHHLLSCQSLMVIIQSASSQSVVFILQLYLLPSDDFANSLNSNLLDIKLVSLALIIEFSFTDKMWFFIVFIGAVHVLFLPLITCCSCWISWPSHPVLNKHTHAAVQTFPATLNDSLIERAVHAEWLGYSVMPRHRLIPPPFLMFCCFLGLLVPFVSQCGTIEFIS